MEHRFDRIAVVNRGEPAMRLIRAVRELRYELDRPLHTVALYTDADRDALFVREADSTVGLGGATVVDPVHGERRSRYLDYATLERALVAAGAEAVWVGWGFVAEHAEFADLCARLGIVFIGPSGEVMRRLGDKISSKQFAEQADVPVAPWSGGPVDTPEEALDHAARLGYPLMVKATAGGGGRGIRKVLAEEDLLDAFTSARSEAAKAFGDATVFLERLVRGARHVEVQIVADHHGQVWPLGVRDCTVQRRNQKVVEESPSPALTPEQERELLDAAARLAKVVGYRNAGTVEFLYDPRGRRFSFMEVNARLQVEHPVTEMLTGADLVKLQIHVASGGRLEGDPPAPSGHAVEVRVNAEDPESGFAPAPGQIELLRLPTGPGVRVDTGVSEGDVIPVEFDSMIAKVIAHGRDRREAVARLQRALSETAIVIRGGTSNKGFLLDLLDRVPFRDGDYDVGWLDRLVTTGDHVCRRGAEIALLQAAVETYVAEAAVARAQFFAAAARGRPEAPQDIGCETELGYQGNTYKLRVYRIGTEQYRVGIDGELIELRVEPLGAYERRLTCAGRRYRILAVAQGLSYLVEVDGVPHRVSRDQGGVVRAPAPGLVVSLAVREGDEVALGDRLVVLEAMKMEMTLPAPFAGKVRDVLVSDGVQIATGAPLVTLEPLADAGPTGSADRLVFAGQAAVAEPTELRARCRRLFGTLHQLLLGFDVDARQLRQMVERQGVLCRSLAPDDDELVQCEERALRIFVDLQALFQREPPDAARDDSRLSAEATLAAYLRDPEAGRKGLPEGFLANLRRALAHYGVHDLERDAALEESLFRVYRAQNRTDEQTTPLLSVLERWLDDVEHLLPGVGDRFRELLDRAVETTRARFPALYDCAREVRYRFYERPLLDEARSRVYAEATRHLDYLAARPDAPDRRERMLALVRCPQPLHGLLARRFPDATPEMVEIMLAVLARRYYRIRKLEEIRARRVEGTCFFTAEYDHDGSRIHLIATRTDYAKLDEVARRLQRIIVEIPAEHDVVADFYLHRNGALVDPDDVRQELLRVLDGVGFPRPLRRIVVVVTGDDDAGGQTRRYFTLRPGADGYYEEKLYRGFHPMMGKRLELWRHSNFDIERLPSVEDVYLFRGVARDNPKDERLFAVVEVRDMTPIRDDSGRVVALPQLERVYMEALAAVRRFQVQRSPRERLHWNRVLLYVWPPIDLQSDELNSLVTKLMPASEGLGIHKVMVRARIPDVQTGELKVRVLHIANPGGRGVVVRFADPDEKPIRSLSEYAQKVVRMRARGLVYPYELVKMMAPDREGFQSPFPAGEFTEHDLGDGDELVPVDRAYGNNRANVVVGVIRNFTAKFPEGMARVVLLGDPSRGMGALAEPECRRIIAALNLAERMRVPVEWFALSAGAKISMDSGTENLDWVGRVLRRIVEYTQAAGEINVIVDGINVGAQPYWNAESTMLMHTRGILVMTPRGAMVLTGKRALDYSGGVSAEDNQGIGGHERIMGPNGQAQYFAEDVSAACQVLFRYYDHAYVQPGERFPRRARTVDARDRDVCAAPHGRMDGQSFTSIGEVFSDAKNPGRKRPFDVRQVMHATVDHDLEPLERWYAMRDAEIAVVWDAHLGGYPLSLIGIESRPLRRLGFVPADGPDQWTAGTLFPLSSKKVARAINAASGNRPVVILANLTGFDGSPESLRNLQLEYGAEIGRAVVNFVGPLVFCVISRYHGGAFVVFSNTLNDNLEVAALEGSYASVIGGAPAAAVVLARDVQQRTRDDTRVHELERELVRADGAAKVRLQARFNEVLRQVRSEKLREVADEFDRVHSIYRARDVGSVHHVIAPSRLRPYLIDAVERGMRRELERWQSAAPVGG